jgi:hypothetical protein
MKNIQQKEYEKAFVVAVADAVPQEITVVVHQENTFLADRAVVRPEWPRNIAVFAERTLTTLIEFFTKVGKGLSFSDPGNMEIARASE